MGILMRGKINGAVPRHKHQPRTRDLERDLATRLNRAEGQLRGVRKMIGEGAYCIDVLQQLSAARRALDKIALLLLRDHLETCVTDAIEQRDATGKVNELIEMLDRFLA
ncbi:MAG: metal-sensitive transcriptional regulator [Candidatus Binataceae bacterium]